MELLLDRPPFALPRHHPATTARSFTKHEHQIGLIGKSSQTVPEGGCFVTLRAASVSIWPASEM